MDVPSAVVQFTKSPAWDTGEAKVLAKFPELVTLHIMGEGFTWETQDRARDIAAATQGLGTRQGAHPSTTATAWCCSTNSTSCCATITSTINDVLTFPARGKPADKHVVITGRNAKRRN